MFIPLNIPGHFALPSSRRALLQAGALGLAGMTWPNLLRAQANTSISDLPGFGRAKQCIFLFMWGGPSQIDTFDPKPLAPTEVRGPFATIPTNVPGIEFSEHFHRTAQHAEKLCVLRSLTHDDPAHLSSVHTVLTGHLPPVNKSDAEPPSDRDTPHVGCVVGKARGSESGLPAAIAMPWIVSHPAAPGGKAPGQHAGWLGHAHDPFLVTGDPNQPGWKVPGLSLIDGQSPDRLASRHTLLETINRQRRQFEQTGIADQLGTQQEQAFRLLTSATVRGAFDLEQETPETRDRYGRHIHGQCVLLARRLIDHGVPFVTVNWHNDGHNFWDTHGNNFKRLEHDLIPPSDRALSSLLEDLSRSGKLDETLIVWVGEFGRGPKINGSAGREHHPRCYSAVLAGGGIRGGQIYGASDRIAEYPAEKATSPQALTATMYHALGFDAETTLHDSVNRPHRLYGANPIVELF
ncbi:MAG: DUF1501 domain-containing protein [Planctomycetaceae bacterium]